MRLIISYGWQYVGRYLCDLFEYIFVGEFSNLLLLP